MEIPRRVARPLLVLGGAALLVTTPYSISAGAFGVEALPWLSLGFTFLVTAGFLRVRFPDHTIVDWFAVVAGCFALIQSFDGVLAMLVDAADSDRVLAVAALGYHLATVAAVIAFAHVLGLFPDGLVTLPAERRSLGALRVLVIFPPLVFVTSPTILLPAYHDPPVVANPFHLAGTGPLETIAEIGLGLVPVAFVVGVVLLMGRYRRGSRDARRRIRWLLVPAPLAGFGAVLDLLLVTQPYTATRLLIDTIWIASLLALPVAIAIALLKPDLLDVDRVLRRSLVYGSLWAVIALVYVVAAAGLGMAAGQRLDVSVAIVLTVLATLVFQPARRRLERLADRWVFGARIDSAQLVARLGSTLAETFDLDTLLPHIEQTLEDGLGLAWARVRLDGKGATAPHRSDDSTPRVEPELTVPINLGTEVLGELQCGPRTNGAPLTDEDRDLVITLARQAALAVRNVKLTAELADRLAEVRHQANELEQSRVRLVRAQETERRRIERNIHDGVQQDLVALLSYCGRIRSQLSRDPAAATDLLDQFQASLQRVIGDLRELAHGIHPTLLTDRGLLEAVEALAARSPIPVTVRADSSLRGLRFAEEVEGAGYFTVAEALTNVLKHAHAAHTEVSLLRSNGSLCIEVHDDGPGFDRTPTTGNGLANLAERLTALGGQLDIDSTGTGTTVRATLTIAASDVPRG
jgi:signal transduction histidine kinase